MYYEKIRRSPSCIVANFQQTSSVRFGSRATLIPSLSVPLSLVGTLAAGPIGDTWDNPAWRKYVADYRAAFKDGLPTPSLFATAYFQNMMAVLTALGDNFATLVPHAKSLV